MHVDIGYPVKEGAAMLQREAPPTSNTPWCSTKVHETLDEIFLYYSCFKCIASTYGKNKKAEDGQRILFKIFQLTRSHNKTSY